MICEGLFFIGSLFYRVIVKILRLWVQVLTYTLDQYTQYLLIRNAVNFRLHSPILIFSDFYTIFVS